MRTFNVTLTKVSEARPDYVNLVINGKVMCEMKYIPGYIYGFYPATNMGEAVYNTAQRIINSAYFNDRGVIGATGDFSISMSSPLISTNCPVS